MTEPEHPRRDVDPSAPGASEGQDAWAAPGDPRAEGSDGGGQAGETRQGSGPAPGGQGQYGQGQYGQGQYGQGQYGYPRSGASEHAGQQYGSQQYGGQYGAQQYGGGYGAQRGPAGYGGAVPQQRGVVPLRPLGLGEILDGAFRSIRHNPRVMFGLSAIVVSLTVLVQTVVQWYVVGLLGGTLLAPTGPGALDVDLDLIIGDLIGAGGTLLVSGLVTFVATTVLTGLLIVSVSRSVIGVRVSLGDAWGRARPLLWRLVLLTLLVVALALVVPLVWAGLLVVAVATAEPLLVGVTLVGGGLAVVVWFAYIGIRTLLATPALMLEEQGVLAGLARGWRLSRGTFWRLLGIYALTIIILSVVATIISAPVGLLVGILGLEPFGDPRALALQGISQVVASVLTTPFVAAVVALLYIDLRIRREGLDVELHRAAEAAAQEADGSSGPRRP